MYDGAPAHFSIAVLNHLHTTYPGKGIVYDETIAWPTCSPDLDLLDFFCSHLKSLVYETLVAMVDDLTSRIVVASGNIVNTPDLFERAEQSFVRQCQLCYDLLGQFKTVVCDRRDPFLQPLTGKSKHHHISLFRDQGPAAPLHPVTSCYSVGIKDPQGQGIAEEVQDGLRNNPRHAVAGYMCDDHLHKKEADHSCETRRYITRPQLQTIPVTNT
ncbi:uncharacterized protein TNCV_2541501 [Trichonephila clavipes]|nr:uncharacterized protein TNCV_2541501 [Trichonephila clavipes]